VSDREQKESDKVRCQSDASLYTVPERDDLPSGWRDLQIERDRPVFAAPRLRADWPTVAFSL
jgi:hypothetical protein